MYLEVIHSTELTYDRLISETVMELRLRPADDRMQRTHQFALEFQPIGHVSVSRDAFDNTVHHYNHRPPVSRIKAVSRSIVETGMAQETRSPEHLRFQFLGFGGPVVLLPEVEETAARFCPDNVEASADVESSVTNLTRWIYEHFRYQKGVTTVRSTTADLIRLGAGVCQDFAHFWIAVCRAMGIAARYVSGYVHIEPKSNRWEPVVSASHAWGEAWVPGLGWRGYDPTNPLEVTPGHVKIAVGRDYRDVPPTKGVFLGPAIETVAVAVHTRRLASMPTSLAAGVPAGSPSR